MSSSPLPHHSEMTPQGYHALSSSQVAPDLGSLARGMVSYDPGKPSIPTPLVQTLSLVLPYLLPLGGNPQPKLFH